MGCEPVRARTNQNVTTLVVVGLTPPLASQIMGIFVLSLRERKEGKNVERESTKLATMEKRVVWKGDLIVLQTFPNFLTFFIIYSF